MQAPTHVSAVALGPVPPKSDKARLQPGSIEVQTTVNSKDSEPRRLEHQVSDELGAREFNDLQHRFAAAGFALHPLHDETLIACRWGMTKTLVGIGAARRFLAMVGGAHAV